MNIIKKTNLLKNKIQTSDKLLNSIILKESFIKREMQVLILERREMKFKFF
jgi:hypothetical protein